MGKTKHVDRIYRNIYPWIVYIKVAGKRQPDFGLGIALLPWRWLVRTKLLTDMVRT